MDGHFLSEFLKKTQFNNIIGKLFVILYIFIKYFSIQLWKKIWLNCGRIIILLLYTQPNTHVYFKINNKLIRMKNTEYVLYGKMKMYQSIQLILQTIWYKSNVFKFGCLNSFTRKACKTLDIPLPKLTYLNAPGGDGISYKVVNKNKTTMCLFLFPLSRTNSWCLLKLSCVLQQL